MKQGATGGFSRALYVLSGASFFIFMGAGAQQAYLVPYLQRVAGWSRLSCGIVVASVYLSMMIFRTANLHLFPRLSDRGFTIIGAGTYLFFTLSMLATAYLKSYPLAILSAWVWGLGAAMMWTGTTLQALAVADRAGGRHGTGMGILYSATQAGWLTGAIVLGLLYRSLPAGRVPLLYAAAAAFTLVGNGLTCLLPRSSGSTRPAAPGFGDIREVMRRRLTAIPCVLQFNSALAFGLIIGVYGSYIEATYGKEWIWISIGLFPATQMVMSAVSGTLADRLGHAPVLAGGFLAGSLGLLVTVLLRHPLAAAVSGFTLGVLSSTVPVVASAMVGSAIEARRRPVVYAVVFGWRDLGVVVASVGANLLGLRFALPRVFLVFTVVFAACAGLSVMLARAESRPAP